MSTDTLNQGIPAGTWKVDPVHSRVHFAISHNGISTFRSGFESFEATLTGGEGARLVGSVDVASVDIDEEMFKGHLMGPDFFDAQKYPQLKFTSTALDVADDGSVRLSGDLEIRGETHAVQALGKFGRLGADLAGAERVGFSLEAAVDRRDFGIVWNAELPSGGDVLEYEVSINVELELLAEAE
jgi:polyisoprenoid-binding protein YceI